MASLAELNAIAGKHDPRAKPQKGSALMQHQIGANEHHVEISERQNKTGKRGAQYAPRTVSGRPERIANPAINIHGPDNSALIEHQTDLMKNQGVAVQKQTQVLSQQTNLMHDQVRATKDVSAVVERLYEYMQKEGNKLSPKVQERAQGNVYDGEFQRVQEKQLMQQEARSRRREISDDLRRQRSDRAKNAERDELGRFKNKKGMPKIQDFGGKPGGMGGIGGRLGGGMARMAGGAIGPLLALATAFYGSKAIEAVSDNYTYDKKNAGGIASAWQTGKDKIYDFSREHLGGGETFLDKQPKDEKKIAAITKSANAGAFGSVSAGFESGSKGVESISTGKGDNGGVSYGKHQLSSSQGTMTAFLRSEEGAKYYNEFRGLKPGSKEFNDKYLDVVKNDKEGMEAAQGAFTKKTHFDPLNAWFGKQYDIDTSQRSRALQEMLYSVSVQYGLGKAKNLIGEAMGNRDPSQMDDAEIIRRIQDHRAATVGSFFRSSDKDTQLGVEKRAGEEKAVYMNMLNAENSGGAVNGSNHVGMGSPMAGKGEFTKAQASFGGKPSMMLASGNGGGGGAANGTVGIMAPGGGSASGSSGNADEAGANAGVEYQDNGNFFNIGVKNVVPKDNTVNLAGLNPKFQKAFFTMVGDWVTNFGGGTVTCASAFRTRAEQEALWVKYGRNTKRVARPGTSRHESGFAIDIDRTSAQALETTGMFKKYGFHRPLSNEPWHVEMVGAGKGGGGVEKSGSVPSPQVMQKAAEQELDKAGETKVASAEEGTRQAVTKESAKAEAEVQNMQAAIAGGADPTVTGEPPAAGKEGGAFADDQASVAQSGITNKTDIINRTPEQQAMYEQYLKSAGGDPRKVPDAFTNPAAYGLNATNAQPNMKVMAPGGPTPPTVTAGQVALDVNGNPYEDLNYRGGKINTMAAPGTPGQVALDVNGNPYEDLNYRGGKINTMATPGVSTQAQNQSPSVLAAQGGNPFGSNPNGTGPVMGPNGMPKKEPGFFDKFGVTPRIHQSGAGVAGGISGGVLGGVNVNQGIRGKGSVYYTPPSVSGILGSSGLGIPGMDGQVGGIIDGLTRGQKPGKDSMVDMAASAAIGGLFSLAQDRPKPMEPTTSPVQSYTSPASPAYYANEQPIVAKAATMAPASVMPVQTTAAPIEATRQSYDPVQSVNVVSAPPQQSAPSSEGPAAGSGAGGGGGSGAGPSEMPQLDEIPAILDDYGLIFINSGYC